MQKAFSISPVRRVARAKKADRARPSAKPSAAKTRGRRSPIATPKRVCRFRLHSGIELCQHSVVLHEIARTEGELDVQQILVCGGPSGHKLENRLAESEF